MIVVRTQLHQCNTTIALAHAACVSTGNTMPLPVVHGSLIRPGIDSREYCRFSPGIPSVNVSFSMTRRAVRLFFGRRMFVSGSRICPVFLKTTNVPGGVCPDPVRQRAASAECSRPEPDTDTSMSAGDQSFLPMNKCIPQAQHTYAHTH